MVRQCRCVDHPRRPLARLVGRAARPERAAETDIGIGRERAKTPAKEPEPPVRERGKGGMDLGL